MIFYVWLFLGASTIVLPEPVDSLQACHEIARDHNRRISEQPAGTGENGYLVGHKCVAVRKSVIASTRTLF